MNQPPQRPLTKRDLTTQMIRMQVGRWTETPSVADLNGLLRLLAKFRTSALVGTYLTREGQTIYAGPFKGMTYLAEAHEGALIARLLGAYESELAPHFEAFIAERLDCVIDVGCAEGYYAVGLARRMPEATIHAFDISERARRECAVLAERNGVADRVKIGAEFKPEDFQAFAGRRALVLIDCEGAEVDILRPDLAPALAGLNIIVETHDVYRPGALATLMDRFSPTHDILRVDGGPKIDDLPPWLLQLGHLDQLLAIWEWREAPTPWLVMRPKTR